MEPEDSIVWISEEELAKQRRIAKDLRKTSWWKKKKKFWSLPLLW
ncbi:hypothetical protein LEP1GSC150_1605 [Leptospira interrogans serovar Copenhageni str. LT2050]|uniref:Uncharacterized protein n=1 Tax=Leptospira interrogans serovar Copenhageni str. LT2050 TaxID=1001598 RepID=M3IHX1_LEPIT|nr:hypothetical protein LEP1GSC150_1605 [Leptospira interrogans serovar Copenhageni str. LT2050]OCC27744.1 Uncharacterized protein GNX_3725 [Leptospira interrogans serovar Canicola]